MLSERYTSKSLSNVTSKVSQAWNSESLSTYRTAVLNRTKSFVLSRNLWGKMTVFIFILTSGAMIQTHSLTQYDFSLVPVGVGMCFSIILLWPLLVYREKVTKD